MTVCLYLCVTHFFCFFGVVRWCGQLFPKILSLTTRLTNHFTILCFDWSQANPDICMGVRSMYVIDRLLGTASATESTVRLGAL